MECPLCLVTELGTGDTVPNWSKVDIGIVLALVKFIF